MATSALPAGGLIDPTKQAEYPIVLGDRLAGKSTSSKSRLYNIQYNYKTKSATAQQRAVITRDSQSRDSYGLRITDKAPNAEQNVLTYSYRGSIDPEQALRGRDEHNLVLVFDPNRKVFVLEPVTTQLNFNLRSAPAKSEKQVLEQYSQLRTLQGEDHGVGDDEPAGDASGDDDGPADDDNPYDYRHFLPKGNGDDDKSMSDNATPEPPSGASKANTPLKPANNPLRLPSKPPKAGNKGHTAASKAASPPRARVEKIEPDRAVEKVKHAPPREPPKSTPSDTEAGFGSADKAAPSPGSNIIIDGDLIIDMGSPPPSRPVFNINPAHFSTPCPAGGEEPVSTTPAPDEDVEDDDALAAEMEAAFEESARQEEERSQQSQPEGSHHYVASEDESEVSEEE
ncbi:hypothetical protein P168DRAFT_286361 [Aspergillus campestris IBT 28561]|uniref:Transcription elongation factor Eaf N-terminal domain-containing protein n=1 Tax=Aspergillus campestris (strain IBT 28561) TaxID=1392248 RepID=A0A2I1DEA2_ASPC2|nr:uncharacterized protein P168DRAFT_286361 [Aspergillus campestris IBT 28561]PKY08212.1 hypothetical protein P168DRAFT_286361 [Aspergillus campestris IBT 28561]